MTVIGLTGPSGSGKGEVGKVMAAAGIPVLDTDAVYHALTDEPSPCTQALAEAFGTEILQEDGSLDRKRLAAAVFCGGDVQAGRCAVLNRITHAFVLKEVRVWLARMRALEMPAAVVDAPMLFESGFDRECAQVVSVLAPEETRLTRIMARDGLSRERALARLHAQKDAAFYRAHSDICIENTGTLEQLRQNAAVLAERLKAK